MLTDGKTIPEPTGLSPILADPAYRTDVLALVPLHCQTPSEKAERREERGNPTLTGAPVNGEDRPGALSPRFAHLIRCAERPAGLRC